MPQINRVKTMFFTQNKQDLSEIRYYLIKALCGATTRTKVKMPQIR